MKFAKIPIHHPLIFVNYLSAKNYFIEIDLVNWFYRFWPAYPHHILERSSHQLAVPKDKKMCNESFKTHQFNWERSDLLFVFNPVEEDVRWFEQKRNAQHKQKHKRFSFATIALHCRQIVCVGHCISVQTLWSPPKFLFKQREVGHSKILEWKTVCMLGAYVWCVGLPHDTIRLNNCSYSIWNWKWVCLQ